MTQLHNPWAFPPGLHINTSQRSLHSCLLQGWSQWLNYGTSLGAINRRTGKASVAYVHEGIFVFHKEEQNYLHENGYGWRSQY